MNRRQLAAWAGMVGPALFVAVFALEGWLRPGYDPLGMYVSELSLGPRGWIQIANFVVLGVLFLLFARGVAAEFREGKASRAGPILLAIIGFSFLVSGPFVMDPASTPRDQWSWHGTLHQLFGALVFSLAPVSCFAFWRRFRDDPNWRSLQWWSLAAGMIVVTFVVLLKVGELPPNALSGWVGLIQRAALVTYLSWVFTFAWALRTRSKWR
jgi:hypothetical protein